MKNIFKAEKYRLLSSKGWLIGAIVFFALVIIIALTTYLTMPYAKASLEDYKNPEYVQGYSDMSKKNKEYLEQMLAELNATLKQPNLSADYRKELELQLDEYEYLLENGISYRITYNANPYQEDFMRFGTIVISLYAIALALYCYAFAYSGQFRLLSITGKSCKSIFFGKTLFSLAVLGVFFAVVALFITAGTFYLPNLGALSVDTLGNKVLPINTYQIGGALILSILAIGLLFWSLTIFLATAMKKSYAPIVFIALFVVILYVLYSTFSNPYGAINRNTICYLPIIGLLRISRWQPYTVQYFVSLIAHILFAGIMYFCSFAIFKHQER